MENNMFKAEKEIIIDRSDDLSTNEIATIIGLEKRGKEWIYTATIKGGKELTLPITNDKRPSEQIEGNKTYKKILGKIKENKEINTLALRDGFIELEATIIKRVQEISEAQEAKEKKEREKYVKRGKRIFERFRNEAINVPQYIASLSRWEIAGEEANVIKILLATMNTARGEATNILSESASASGKTHIENAGFSFIHRHHYVMMNFSTTASFRNQALEDPYMFQNKVVRLGDLGNEANQEVLEEVMGIIKILNSEGVYESYKMATDGKTQLHFTLYGKTAMCYSKVANNLKISEQDASRGILYSPNPLNDVDFEEFAMWKNTPDYITNYKEYVDEKVEEIRDYMEYLIDCDVKIINPYQKQISAILKKNKAYRRVLTKELWLLNSLALLNLPNKKVYEIDGGKFIYVSVQDVMNYLTLYKPDIIANSNYDMDVHSYRLYELISQDYEPIGDGEVMQVFTDELKKTESLHYDDHKFKHSNKFFTINTVLDKYRGTHQLTNIISEVKKPKDKIRRVLQNMIGLIGYTTIPDENYNNKGTKPTLYYICKNADITNLINKLVMDKKTLYLIDHLGMGKLIPDIIDDFKTVSGYGEALLKKDKIVIEFREYDCDIMVHHPDIRIPPTQYITEETVQRVDKIWDENFSHLKTYHKRTSNQIKKSEQVVL